MNPFEDEFKERGLKLVKDELSLNLFGRQDDPNATKARAAKRWIEDQEEKIKEINEKQQTDIAEKSNQISEEANKIAKDANKKSEKANKFAFLALIASAISILISILLKL